jgi:hypothetical protein
VIINTLVSVLIGLSAAAPDAAFLGAPFYSGTILPTPQQAEYGDAVVLMEKGQRLNLKMAYAGPAAPLAERLLRKRIAPFSNAADTPGKPVLVCLAQSDAARQWAADHNCGDVLKKLPAQGYVLAVRPDGVLCAGADNRGVVNAVASLIQLLHVKEETLLARECAIRDWPEFTTRYTAEYHLPGRDFLDWMMTYKINGFGACYPGMNWEGLTDAKRKGLKVIGEYKRAYQTLDFMAQFHAGGRRCAICDAGNPAHIARLLDTISETLELSGADHIMICYDDVVPVLQPMEKALFASTAEAHAHIMKKVLACVKAESPGTVVSFCPPYYQGRGHRRWRAERLRETGLAYLADLGKYLPEEVRPVWTGPVTESRRIVPEDISSYQDWMGIDRPLFYWDNTWHYHQPLRNFHARYPENFVNYCAGRTSYINVNGTLPIGRFFAATANDYYWNPDAFEPDRAWRAAVAQFMGPAAVPVAERFYDLRGEDYFVFFTRDADLDALGAVIRKLEETSLTPGIPEYCRKVYEGMVEKRSGS